jgi:glycosyltransferase involved in cell wall biosynthesis
VTQLHKPTPISATDSTTQGVTGGAPFVAQGFKFLKKPRVCFFVAGGKLLSGQRLATTLIIDALSDEIDSTIVELPTLDRGPFQHVRFLGGLFRSWIECCRAARQSDIFHFSLGQTWTAFVRDAVPLLIVSLFKRSGRRLFSLNGHLFTFWKPGSLKARVFRALLDRGSCVTVVGPTEKIVLREVIGVRRAEIIILDNPSELPPTSLEHVQAKHRETEPVKLLFLSNLFETKGYPLFLDALLALSQKSGPRIEATLAGVFANDKYVERFKTSEHARAWINTTIAAINSSARVTVRWIQGARGVLKAQLFREAHLFILPTTYPVEAQPLVLLEAMASGCAIITSKIGEIPSTAVQDSAVLLETLTTEALVSAIESLIPAERRLYTAECGLRLFQSRFSHTRYIQNWKCFLRLS